MYLAAHLALGDLQAGADQVAQDAAQYVLFVGRGDFGADDGRRVVNYYNFHEVSGPPDESSH